MKDTTWGDIERVFDRVMDAPPARRAALLDSLCAGQPALRDAVTRLIDADRNAGDFLASPASGPVDEETPPATDYSLGRGDSIGIWTIECPLGRGGMGEVYLANRSDQQFTQQAAIKRLPTRDPDRMSRFQRERQILADLDHPNIARLLDGGVDELDHPFMAMEYVDGLPLLDYCTQNRLTLEQRLRLFMAICNAVVYAHQHLVIHRDIKPANILVRDDGTPKLLDFGIASLIDESGGMNGQLTQALYTPNYAAPEQLAGGQITTTTDVHGLGAVLYALISGRPPQELDGLALPTAINRVLTAVPAPPSRVEGSLLRGSSMAADLDAICSMALRKEPNARYPSALALREDIEAMLAMRPVAARRGAKRYVLGRFVRRNWIAVAASTAFVALLIGALTATTIYAQRAAVQRDIALRDSARVSAMRDTMARVLGVVGARQESGEPMTAIGLLENALAELEDEFADDPGSQAEALRMIGAIFYAMDDWKRAEPILARVAEHPSPDVPEAVRALSRFDLAQIRFETGDLESTTALFNAAHDYWLAHADQYEVELIHSASMHSRLHRLNGESEEAVSVLEDAVRRADRHWGRNHEETAIVLNNLVVAHYYNNDLDAAQAISKEAWDIWEAVGTTDSVDALATISNWGSIALKRGDLVMAATRIERATALRQTLYGPSAAVARQMLSLSAVQMDNGELEEALATVDKAIPMARTYGEVGDRLTTGLGCQRGQLLLRSGKHAEAIEQLESTLLEVIPSAQNDVYAGDCRVLRGHAMAVNGDFDDAEKVLDGSIEALKQTGEPGRPHLALALAYRARLALYRGDEDAVQRFRDAISIREKLYGPDHYLVLLLRCELGRALIADGELERGTDLIDTSMDGLERQFGAEHDVYQRAAAIRAEAMT